MRPNQFTLSLVLVPVLFTVAGQKSFADAEAGQHNAIPAAEESTSPKADGYRGIWYSNQPSKDEYAYKYSGGYATYPQQHIPIAIYAPKVNKTFFCYGGTERGKNQLLHMVSYFDHNTSTVPRPTILLNKQTTDAHDNPVLSLDDKGYIWIFSPSHGGARPTFIHRSTTPYSIDAFTAVTSWNFSYPQPWHFDGHGFVFLHTRYDKGRSLYCSKSDDGTTWSQPVLLSRFGQGHYQISNRSGNLLATAFNFHPPPLGLDARTNLYYMQTRDFGETWTNAAAAKLQIPLTSTSTLALVHDYQREGLLVYLKDIGFTSSGNPVILFLTSKGFASGPANDPRQWNTARWTGHDWDIRPVFSTDHNYDFGSLYIEADGMWRIIAPTDQGPQAYNPGGEVVMWLSRDEGATWQRAKTLTRNSQYNHTYVRRPLHANPDFYALWADGNTRKPSASHLYFCNRDGDVWRLPDTMTSDTARAMPVP